MAGNNQAFFGLDLATLLTMRSQFTTAIQEIATIGQSVSIPGRSVSSANLSELTATLDKINQAIDYKQGSRITRPVVRYGG